MDDVRAVSGGSDLHVRIADRLGCSVLHSHSRKAASQLLPTSAMTASFREASSNTAGTQRHDSAAFAYNRPRAPVAQWIEQPPPKGQVARSIRVRGATSGCVGLLRRLCRDEGVQFHARFVYPRHRGIGLEVALVENCVQHLRHEAAIGDGDLVAETVFAVLSFLREKR